MAKAVSASIHKKSNKYSNAKTKSTLSQQKIRPEKGNNNNLTIGRKYEKRNKKKTQLLDYFLTPATYILQGMGAPRLLKNKSGLWTGLMLFALTWSVQGYSQEELAGDGTRLLDTQEVEDAALHYYFQKMYEQYMLQQLQARRLSAAETSLEGIPERLPHPFALQNSPSSADDSSIEKRGASSYMNLCHFKICQIGKKRSSGKLYSRFQK